MILVLNLATLLSDTRPALRLPDYCAIRSTADHNVEGVWIDSLPPHLIVADLTLFASVACVKPIRIPGYWYGKDIKSAPKPTMPVSKSDKVFLFLHGGAFTLLSAHPSAPFMPDMYRSLLNTVVPHLFLVEYRLSLTHPLPEENPFPAALLDALVGYVHLVDVMGYDPANVIVAGDSAGGNIALALAHYLVENRGRHAEVGVALLPAPPGYLLLISPWADMSNSHSDTHLIYDVSTNNNPAKNAHANDMDVLGEHLVGREYPPYNVLAYVGPFGLGMMLHNWYISPVSLYRAARALFMGFPRTFITSGGAERFLDQTRTLRDKMMKDMDKGLVTYYEGPDGIHDFICYPSHPGYRAVQDAIRNWLAPN